jgi:hypothetical protein
MMSESPQIGDLLRSLTVKVNSSIGNGSGILCKPASDADFLYILTARHIIANGPQIVTPEEVSLEFWNVQLIGKYQLHTTDRILTFNEEEKDIAVLVIPTAEVEKITGQLPVVSCVKDWFGLKECLFRGFPEANMGIEPTRMDGEIVEGQKHFDFQFEFLVPQPLEGRWNNRTENFLAFDNVGGFSGSGVFVLNDDEIHLLGVVSKFGAFNRFWGIKADLLSELFPENGLLQPAWIVPETRPEVRAGIKRLRENSHDVRRRIVTQVGGKWQVERADLQGEILQKIHGDATFFLVSGAAGTGKSAFVEQVVRKLEPGGWQVWAYRGDQFCHDEVGKMLRDMGIQASMTDLLQSPTFVGNLLIWIDGAEKLVETMKFEALLNLMRLVVGRSNIRLLLTLRKFSVQHFKTRLAGLVQPILVDVPPLTDEELADAAATFPHIQPLLQSPKLKRLLKLPFYLDQAVKLPEIQPDASQEMDEIGFRALVWKEHIEKHIPSRGRQFEGIVMRRARNLSSFELPESPDDMALKGLEANHIIVRETGGNQERFAPAHDIFEDWALMRHVQRCWDRRQTPESFIADLGGDYAIRRGFRFWLEENLSNDNATVTVRFLEKILDSADSVAAFWKDEIMVSVLQSPHGSQFLQDHYDKLFENQAAIFGRFLRIYRTACKEPLTDGSGQDVSAEQWRLFSMNFRPVGLGWGTLVRFIWENFDQIPDKNLIANFLRDWGNQVEPFKPLPEFAREAALCLLKLLEGWKNKYGYGVRDGHDREIKACVRLLFGLAEVVKEELRELLETASHKVKNRDREDWQANKFYKLLLETSLSYFFSQKLCLYTPDTVIAIANEHWKKTYTKDDIYYHHDFLDSCKEYGIDRDDYIRYSPVSALQTPMFWLLTFHPNKALTFLVELFNYAARNYREADFEYKKEVHEVLITLNDERQVW